MGVKLAVWAAFSLLVGKVLNTFFAPTEMLYAISLFAAPFLLLGFQHNYTVESSSWKLLGFEIFSSRARFRQLTFWGVIPLGEPTQVGGVERSILEGVARFLPALLEAIARRRLLPAK